MNIITISEKLDRLQEQLSEIQTKDQRVLNIKQVAELTGLSKSTIYKFTHTKKIPHYKQAKHLYFDRQEIEDWLLANKS